jgi:hypothetical protein
MEKINKKVKKYETLLIDLLNDLKGNDPDAYVVIDKQNRHYQLLTAGWDSRIHYLFSARIHFHLREDGIICLFENRTEHEVGDTLMEQGVPKSDILVSFLPQTARQYAGYAAA